LAGLGKGADGEYGSIYVGENAAGIEREALASRSQPCRPTGAFEQPHLKIGL